jgi:hypothetical protein
VIGNSIPLKNVTPAELMILVADNHSNAGGNPIVAKKEIPPEHEEAALKQADKAIAAVEEAIDKINEDNSMDPDVQAKRLRLYGNKLNRLQNQVDKLKNIQRLRLLSPSQERDRLMRTYGEKRVKSLFPGAMPTLPSNFDEATQAGLQTSLSGGGALFSEIA